MKKTLLFLLFYSVSLFTACYAQNICLQKMNEGHTLMHTEQYEKAIAKYDSVLFCLPETELYTDLSRKHTLCIVYFNKNL